MRVMRLVAIETKCHKNSIQGLILSRKDELDDLIAAFSHRLHEEHPNPERAGCPGLAALTRLATQPEEALGASSILDHVRQCSPCLDELRGLRMSKPPKSPCPP